MKTKTTKPQAAHTPDDIPFTIHMEPRTAEQIKHERLIAAAPMMLVACEAAATHACSAFECGGDRTACPVLGYLRAAILAAKGA